MIEHASNMRVIRTLINEWIKLNVLSSGQFFRVRVLGLKHSCHRQPGIWFSRHDRSVEGKDDRVTRAVIPSAIWHDRYGWYERTSAVCVCTNLMSTKQISIGEQIFNDRIAHGKIYTASVTGTKLWRVPTFFGGALIVPLLVQADVDVLSRTRQMFRSKTVCNSSNQRIIPSSQDHSLRSSMLLEYSWALLSTQADTVCSFTHMRNTMRSILLFLLTQENTIDEHDSWRFLSTIPLDDFEYEVYLASNGLS